jgi:hypothetical protein
LRKDGSRFLADVVIDALKDDAGRLIGFAKITRDVTERVQAAQVRIGLMQSRAEEALRRVQAELAHVARVTTLGELTPSIAHELNQPIGSTLLDAQAAVCCAQIVVGPKWCGHRPRLDPHTGRPALLPRDSRSLGDHRKSQTAGGCDDGCRRL